MRLGFLIPTAFLLFGCVDKRNECAQYSAGLNDGVYWEEISATYKKLGIRGDVNKQTSAHEAIENYCAFYKG